LVIVRTENIMGYDVHITRATDWTNSDSNPITLDEWLAYIESDPEMRLDGFAEPSTPAGDRIRYENPGLAVWIKRPGHDQDDNQAWFDHSGGRIVVKSPDNAILAKMCAIAEKMGARVQGDDGEYYPEAPKGGTDESATMLTPPTRSSWWRRLFVSRKSQR
jgi:hypothetical protein